jgi:Gpi18-like mannosyltransferase
MMFFGLGLSRNQKFLFGVSILLQTGLLFIPDTGMGDLELYRIWCRHLVLNGLEGAYWGNRAFNIDYPPLIPYMQLVLGSIARWINPEWLFDDRWLTVVLKIPGLLFNLALAWLVLFYALKSRLTVSNKAFCLVTFSPLFIFDSLYWGQTNSFVCFLVLSSFLLLKEGKLIPAYLLFTLACFAKPMVWPLSLLVLLFSMKHKRFFEIQLAFSLSALLALFILTPFALEGNFSRIVSKMFFSIDSMSFVSANAHNFWWVVTRGFPWEKSSSIFLMGLSYKTSGVLIFLSVYTFLLYKYFVSNKVDYLFPVASMAYLTFFVFSPHMHNNHMLMFFPLAFFMLLDKPFYFRCYVALLCCAMINMIIHDPYLRSFFPDLGPVMALNRIEGKKIYFYAYVISKINATVILLIYVLLLMDLIRSFSTESPLASRPLTG